MRHLDALVREFLRDFDAGLMGRDSYPMDRRLNDVIAAARLERQRWMEFTEPMVKGLHGLHSAIPIEACEVERCRAWVVLRSEGAPTADEVRGILA